MDYGIHVIDTGFHRPRFDAAYLIVENGRGAFLDCGTSHSVPALLGAVEKAGLRPADIDWLILSHVHLDHAGGAGALLEYLPDARVVVHPRGAPHMIDPARLIAGATAVYGEEEMARSYGTIVPIPESRVDIARDGHRVDLAGRTLACLDTPGHALHHLCLWDATSRSVFTGDTFGISYRELDTDRGIFLFPTTTPVQFDPEALKTSIARLVALEPERAFLTHFGAIDHIPQNARSLIEQVDAMSRGALALIDAPDRHAALVAMLDALYVPRAVAHSGLAEDTVRDILGMDIELNAQGLGVWLNRQR
jgi:glyoxylase-like metal-dependent hydrolase (beta-lactamase superfamily II)